MCKPIYTQHIKEHRYVVKKPMVECYQVVVPYTVCKPVYEKHITVTTTRFRRTMVQTYQVAVPPRCASR